MSVYLTPFGTSSFRSRTPNISRRTLSFGRIRLKRFLALCHIHREFHVTSGWFGQPPNLFGNSLHMLEECCSDVDHSPSLSPSPYPYCASYPPFVPWEDVSLKKQISITPEIFFLPA